MWKVITDIKIPEVSDEFYRILLRTALGQGIEQIWTNERKKLTEDEYFFVADGKSAYYSITGPMRLGAITAGATQNEINRITDFGLHLGRCFQLVDDLVDADQDRKEKKTTLVTTKGLAYVKGLAAKERDNAKKIFEKDLSFLKEEPARIELKELIDFILERKY